MVLDNITGPNVMSIEQILTSDSVLLDLKPACKREALASLAHKAADLTGEDGNLILDTLMERERLGSTGVGDGIAIPHGKIKGLARITGIFARFEQPIDFDAVDGAPVDLCFLLLAPSNATAAHLKALAKVARLFRDAETREALRNADTATAAFTIATTSQKSNAA